MMIERVFSHMHKRVMKVSEASELPPFMEAKRGKRRHRAKNGLRFLVMDSFVEHTSFLNRFRGFPPQYTIYYTIVYILE